MSVCFLSSTNCRLWTVTRPFFCGSWILSASKSSSEVSMYFRLVSLNLLEFVMWSLGVAVFFVVPTRAAIGSLVLPLSTVAVVSEVALLLDEGV